MTQFQELQTLVTSGQLVDDLTKIEMSNNKAAKTRVRVAMQRIRAKAQEIRIALAPPKQAK
jgi:hypothetical protein